MHVSPIGLRAHAADWRIALLLIRNACVAPPLLFQRNFCFTILAKLTCITPRAILEKVPRQIATPCEWYAYCNCTEVLLLAWWLRHWVCWLEFLRMCLSHNMVRSYVENKLVMCSNFTADDLLSTIEPQILIICLTWPRFLMPSWFTTTHEPLMEE